MTWRLFGWTERWQRLVAVMWDPPMQPSVTPQPRTHSEKSILESKVKVSFSALHPCEENSKYFPWAVERRIPRRAPRKTRIARECWAKRERKRRHKVGCWANEVARRNPSMFSDGSEQGNDWISPIALVRNSEQDGLLDLHVRNQLEYSCEFLALPKKPFCRHVVHLELFIKNAVVSAAYLCLMFAAQFLLWQHPMRRRTISFVRSFKYAKFPLRLPTVLLWWHNASPVHSGHPARLYQISRVVIDHILPTSAL